MTAKTGNKLSPCNCVNLRRVTGTVTDYYNRAIESCGLTINQFSLLWNLDFLETSNITALAERMGLERSTLVRNLKPLTMKGYIEDTAGAGERDRRLKVTPKGKMALEIGIPLWKEAQKYIKAVIGAENMDVFRDILLNLQEI